MKSKILLVVAGLFIIFSSCKAQAVNKDLNEFAIDLASANIKLRGSLLLIGEYKDNLSTLTFERYSFLLKQYETPSTRGVSKAIKEANNHFFHSNTSSFQVVLYIKRFNAVIFDDANTFGIDSIKILRRNEEVPDLVEFISKKIILN
jgi:hypothetical protein